MSALRALADDPDYVGFLSFYRERFIMALAQNYCDNQISWDEYVRTCAVVQAVLDDVARQVAERAEAIVRKAV